MSSSGSRRLSQLFSSTKPHAQSKKRVVAPARPPEAPTGKQAKSMASSGWRPVSALFLSAKPRAQPQMRVAAPALLPKAPTGKQAKPNSMRTQRKALRRILDDIFKERDPYKLARKFVTASTANAHFRNRHQAYEKAVSLLASSGHHDAVTAIIEAQKPFLDLDKEDFAARLVSLYGRASMPSHAAATFRDLPPQLKSVNTFNALLAAYVDSDDFDAIATSFQEIPASCPSVVPNLYSYNILISGLCKKPDLSAALGVIALMEKHDLSPDIISFNTLLNGYYNNGSLDDAVKVWDMMKQWNVQPDTKMYNAKLWGLVARGRIEDAAAVIEVMEKDGPKPDTESYNELIRGYCKEGRLDDAKKVFDDLVKKNGKCGPKPDTISYNELIKGYCKEGRLDDSKKLYSDLLKSECVPNGGVFEALVPRLVETGELDCALDCCHEMFSRKCRVDGSLLQMVITALVAASRVQEATRIVKLGRKNGYSRKFLMIPPIGENNDIEAITDQCDSTSSADVSEEKEESQNAS